MRSSTRIDKNPTGEAQVTEGSADPPDPYAVEEAEAVIRVTRKHWGDFEANYVEFGFFTGCRPSELIALRWEDVDLKKAVVRISKARIMASDKATTKTSVLRDIELCPRALQVLTWQKGR